jgi:hypothetical protein
MIGTGSLAGVVKTTESPPVCLGSAHGSVLTLEGSVGGRIEASEETDDEAVAVACVAEDWV